MKEYQGKNQKPTVVEEPTKPDVKSEVKLPDKPAHSAAECKPAPSGLRPSAVQEVKKKRVIKKVIDM
jgi:hypothetical protein